MKTTILAIAVLALSLSSCKKKAADPTPDPTPAPVVPAPDVIDINSVPRATFDMDGTTFAYKTDETVYFSGSASEGPFTTNHKYTAGISNADDEDLIYIEKGTLVLFEQQPTDPDFSAFFPVGNVAYSVDAASGVAITVRDASGVKWSTDLGSGNQSGSTFTIVQKMDDPDLADQFYVKFYATFSCKVYNSAGAVKTITNGKYVGHFGNF